VTPEQFRSQWWVSVVSAAATLLAVGAALFGDWFRKKFLPPSLRLKVLEKYGEKTSLTRQIDGRVEHVDDVRYYHLNIWNARRWTPATGVQVFLTGIEELGPDNLFHLNWIGNVPLRWRDQEVVPILQTIGAAKDCDFCMIQKKKAFVSLMPLLVPNNLKGQREGKCRFVARLQVRSNEADSDEIRIEVAWDGIWEDGDLEMHNHLTVKKLGPVVHE
jgi:hypothetical protein